MKTKSESLFKELRQKAESLVSDENASLRAGHETDIKQLLHELHVHQIELEIQNEELRNAQRELEISRDWFAYLYHHAPVGYVILDESAMIVQTNQTFVDILGVGADDLSHVSFLKYVAETDRKPFLAKYKAFFKNPQSRDLQVRLIPDRKGLIYTKIQGSRITWDDQTSFGRGSGERLLISVNDITGQKQSEEALIGVNEDLKKRTGELTSLLDCTRAVLNHNFFAAAARRIFDAARSAIGAVSGYVALLSDDGAENEVLFLEAGGMPCDVDPELPMPIRGLRAEAYKTARVVYDNQFADSRWADFMPAGHVRLDNVLFAPLIIEGKVSGLIGLANKPGGFTEDDVRLADTFGEFAAIALRNSNTMRLLEREKNRLAVTLWSIGDGVITTDHEGRIMLVNKAAETLTGWSQERASGKPVDEVFQLIDENTRASCDNPVNTVMETENHVVFSSQLMLVSEEAEEFNVIGSAAPIFDNRHHLTGVALVFRDITEKVRLEARMIQAQKMESIGVLAGGVAHNFNNILSIILGNSEILMDDLDESFPGYPFLEDLQAACLRGRDVVKQLLDYTARAPSVRKPENLCDILDNTFHLIRASIPANIAVHQTLPDAPAVARVDVSQLNQVIVNLCANAAQSMENKEGGSVEIVLDRIESDHPDLKSHPDKKTGAYARIRIKDTGHGIPEDIRKKVFDPYYTTRPVGKGSGMGLAVVHGVIQSHEGFVRVDSEPGEGSVFSIYLPVVDGNGVRECAAPAELPKGNERILFIDDEPPVTKMAEQILGRLGYRVTAETDPMKALEHFKSVPRDYDLVISDMAMPSITGDKLASEILTIRKDMPIIICTGYSAHMNERKAKAIGIKKYIEKPIDRSKMAFSVREVLDESTD